MRTIHKTLLVLAASLAFWSVGSAQEIQQFKKHEISIGVAPIPFWGVFTGHDYNEPDGIIDGIYGKRDRDARFIPLFSIACNHYYKKMVLSQHKSLLDEPVQICIFGSRLAR